MDTTTPTDLPTTIHDFLAAHVARDTAAAARAFSPDPVVEDEGRTYRGADELLEFLTKAGSQYTYTTALVGAEQVDAARWVVVVRLEGDFPGGVAELRYRFTLVDDRIAGLVIAP